MNRRSILIFHLVFVVPFLIYLGMQDKIPKVFVQIVSVIGAVYHAYRLFSMQIRSPGLNLQTIIYLFHIFVVFPVLYVSDTTNPKVLFLLAGVAFLYHGYALRHLYSLIKS